LTSPSSPSPWPPPRLLLAVRVATAVAATTPRQSLAPRCRYWRIARRLHRPCSRSQRTLPPPTILRVPPPPTNSRMPPPEMGSQRDDPRARPPPATPRVPLARTGLWAPSPPPRSTRTLLPPTDPRVPPPPTDSVMPPPTTGAQPGDPWASPPRADASVPLPRWARGCLRHRRIGKTHGGIHSHQRRQAIGSTGHWQGDDGRYDGEQPFRPGGTTAQSGFLLRRRSDVGVADGAKWRRQRNGGGVGSGAAVKNDRRGRSWGRHAAGDKKACWLA